jgi:hypothetical protein
LKIIKEKVGRYYLKKLTNPKRQFKPKNLDLVNSFGIIHTASTREEHAIIKNFVKYLKSEFGIRNVLSLGFHRFPEKQIPEWMEETLHNKYFSKKELNFYQKPVSASANDFIQEKFDVLVNLDLKELLPQKFVLALSQAAFKVGKTSADNSIFCDMTIQLKPTDKEQQLIEYTIHYLKLINKDEHKK